jgi:hypothetical protein
MSGVRRLLMTVSACAVMGVGGAVAFAAPAAASPGALKVLITYSEGGGTPPAKLQGQIAALPGVASVDTFDNSAATPSDATLDQYDVVVVTDSTTGPVDPVALGNNLADYEDQGGVVVATEFFWQNSGDAAAGRWLTGGYSPYQIGTSGEFATVTLGTHDATSPLLEGVSTLSDYYHENPALAVGATEIAKWSDGFSAVAFKGNAVGINAYVGNYGGGTSWSGDYAKIIVNAGNVLGRHTLTITKGGTGAGSVTSVPAGINCGATCAFDYTNGTAVTLTAVPSSGSSFTGWSGAGCSGTGTCTVTMRTAQSVRAMFNGGEAAPGVVTGAASPVTGSRAVLHGTVNPGNAATTYYFQYGGSKYYGTQVPVAGASVGSGASNAAVSQLVSKLVPGKKYHFRVVAKNYFGTSWGGDRTFRTPRLISSLRVSPTAFTAQTSGASIGTKGTKVAYKLGERATVTFTVKLIVKGRHGTRYVNVKGSLKRTSEAVAVAFKFTGRLNNQALAAGNYLLTAFAQGAGAHLRASVRFTIT